MYAEWFDFKALAAEMKRLQRRNSAPWDEVQFPTSVEEGDGIVALLELLFGGAGYARTAKRIGLDGDISVWHFIKLFSESAKNLKISKRQLRQTYEALSQDPGNTFVN